MPCPPPPRPGPHAPAVSTPIPTAFLGPRGAPSVRVWGGGAGCSALDVDWIWDPSRQARCGTGFPSPSCRPRPWCSTWRSPSPKWQHLDRHRRMLGPGRRDALRRGRAPWGALLRLWGEGGTLFFSKNKFRSCCVWVAVLAGRSGGRRSRAGPGPPRPAAAGGSRGSGLGASAPSACPVVWPPLAPASQQNLSRLGGKTWHVTSAGHSEQKTRGPELRCPRSRWVGRGHPSSSGHTYAYTDLQVQTGWLCCAASGPGGDLSGAFIPSPAPAHSAPHCMWPLPPQVSLTMSLEQVWAGSYPRGAGRWRAAAPPRVRNCHAQARACQRPGTGRGRWTRGAAASTALHGGRGTACHPPALWCPGCPPAEARKEKPEAEQAPAPQRTYGSREPATHSALTGSPKALSLAGSCRRQACSPARHPTCLTCLTSRSLHPPGPQVPRLPFLFSASVWLPTAVPPARAQRPGRAGPAHLHPRAAGASPPPMRGRVGLGLLRAAG